MNWYNTANRIMLSNIVYNNLYDGNRKLCSQNSGRGCYRANVVNTAMNDWLKG